MQCVMLRWQHACGATVLWQCYGMHAECPPPLMFLACLPRPTCHTDETFVARSRAQRRADECDTVAAMRSRRRNLPPPPLAGAGLARRRRRRMQQPSRPLFVGRRGARWGASPFGSARVKTGWQRARLRRAAGRLPVRCATGREHSPTAWLL